MRGKPWTRWQEWALGVLGGWCLLSPWPLGVGGGWFGMWQAWLVGLAVMGLAIWALAVPSNPRPVLLNLALGLWLFVTAWPLGFAGLTGVAWNAGMVGAAVALLAAWVLPEAKGLQYAASLARREAAGRDSPRARLATGKGMR